MTAAIAPSVNNTTPSLRTQAPADVQHEARFAATTAQLLEQLSLGATGSVLAPLLARSVASLRPRDLRLEQSVDAVLVNTQAVAPTAAAAWRSYLLPHGIQRVDFHREVSGAELLHFLVLLSAPIGEISLAKLWLERGAWRIHLEAADVPDTVCGVTTHDVVTLLTELVSANGSPQRDVTNEELDLLSNAVACGVSVAEGSPLRLVLSAAGERAVQSLLVTLANATSGSQRRTLFEMVAMLNAGHQYLVTLLAHPTWFVVRNAASLLGELRVPGADAALSALLKHEDARVRVAAVTALGKSAADAATESLRVAVADRSAEVRAAAWSIWRHRDHAPAVEVINRALREERDEAVQRAVLDCVAHFPTLDVANALIRFCAHAAANAAPLDLFAHAIELLAQRRPQSARQFLRHLADAQAR